MPIICILHKIRDMKTTMPLLLLILLACTSYSQTAGLKFIQNGTPVTPVNGVLELKKQPFSIEVTLDLNDIDGVYVYSDFTDIVYKIGDKDPLPDLQDIPYKVIPEVNYAAHQIVMSNDNWAFWFYDKNKSEQHFEKDIKMVNDHTVTGTKIIEQFYNPTTEKVVKVGDVAQPLYLVFVVTNPFQKRGLVKEYSRQKVKISWAAK